jgi:hypothetical protein
LCRYSSLFAALLRLEAREGIDEGISELNRIRAQGLPNFLAHIFIEIEDRGSSSRDSIPSNVLMKRLQEKGIRFHPVHQLPSEYRGSLGSPFVVRITRAQISDLEEALSSVNILSSEYMGMPDADRE